MRTQRPGRGKFDWNQYGGGTAVVIYGPIFMARLPAGAYSVDVSYEGRPQARKVKVGERLRTEYFRWPSDPAADLPVLRWVEPEAEPKSRAKR